MIQKTYYKTYRTLPDPPYVTITNDSDTSVYLSITKEGTPNSTDLSYSTDNGITWTDVHNGGGTTIASGGNVKLRSSTGFSKDNNNYYRVNLSRSDVQVSLSGHIATLIDYENWDSITAIPNYCFYSMSFLKYSGSATNGNTINNSLSFDGITTVGDYSCYQMFFATNFITPPDFSSITTIGNSGFNECFRYCEKTTGQYNFSNVTSIGTAAFYSAFNSNIRISTFPDFSKLTTAPNDSFQWSFQNCTSLTSVDLSNFTSVSNFRACFKDCTNLNYIKTPNVSSWNTNTFNGWVENVAATGLFLKPTNLTVPEGISGYPSGWTVENY